jgi:hypothetical protein
MLSISHPRLNAIWPDLASATTEAAHGFIEFNEQPTADHRSLRAIALLSRNQVRTVRPMTAE